ncbi:hypothetical protein IFM89_013123 [Coptis chinensis]|uniref:Calnexin homolog n=1 Tax=Coptis chinensis TaxID=261450 RepID=A0A835IM50_9MAGN|nr:hypothetical protein IFM89_013123 [Coptis chinensis]
MSLMKISLLIFIACVGFQLCIAEPLFYESFDDSFEGRWIVSEKDDYQGVWKWAKSEGHEDYGLLVSDKAKKYAIVKELDDPVDLKDGTVILQYETRLQNGLECGGAYLKYLRPQEAGWKSKEFDNDSPYSIMFGPDKCGSTNKVHFIFKHKNPKSGEYVEHHLKFPPSVPSDKLSHVYTAVLKPSNELVILIDGEEKKTANFLSAEDFEPALIPAKTIPDPDDKKPEDWDEREKIPDSDAVKPEDWDENAPMEIEDEEAVKPEGWLDDEPEEVDDPEASKPEDWDDEEDGEWEAPKIETQSVRQHLAVKKVFDILYKIADVPFLEAYKNQIVDIIEKGEKQPNITIGILVSVVVVFLTIFYRIIFGGKKPVAKVIAKETKKATAAETSEVDQGTSGEKEEENEKEDAAAPRRRSRRET